MLGCGASCGALSLLQRELAGWQLRMGESGTGLPGAASSTESTGPTLHTVITQRFSLSPSLPLSLCHTHTASPQVGSQQTAEESKQVVSIAMDLKRKQKSEIGLHSTSIFCFRSEGETSKGLSINPHTRGQDGARSRLGGALGVPACPHTSGSPDLSQGSIPVCRALKMTTANVCLGEENKIQHGLGNKA